MQVRNSFSCSKTGEVSWTENKSGISITVGKKTHTINWIDVSAACEMIPSPLNLPPQFPVEILPGVKQLLVHNKDLEQNYTYLVIARGKTYKKSVQILLPRNEKATRTLVDSVIQYVGDKWKGELPREKYAKELGLVMPLWVFPFILLVFVIGFPMLILAMGSFFALTSFDIELIRETPLVAWFSLGVWLVLVGGILLILKIRR